jgi:hypothetical protein
MDSQIAQIQIFTPFRTQSYILSYIVYSGLKSSEVSVIFWILPFLVLSVAYAVLTDICSAEGY